MTDKKKPKKEKAGYEIEYLRRATIDADYNYCGFRVKFDPSKIDGKTVVQDTEKMVVFARELTASKEPKKVVAKGMKDIGKALAPEIKKALKEANLHPKVGKTEDIKIADLKAGDKVNINVRFLKAGDIKRFTRPADGTEGKYCKVDLEDKDGSKIKMTLFDEQIELIEGVKENAWLSIQNAYCKDYKGTLELSVSYAKIEAIYT